MACERESSKRWARSSDNCQEKRCSQTGFIAITQLGIQQAILPGFANCITAHGDQWQYSAVQDNNARSKDTGEQFFSTGILSVQGCGSRQRPLASRRLER